MTAHNVANFCLLGGTLSHTITGTVYAECEYIVPVPTRERNFPFISHKSFKFCFLLIIFSDTVTGTVYTICLFTVPVPTQEGHCPLTPLKIDNFSLLGRIFTRTLTATEYNKCLYTVFTEGLVPKRNGLGKRNFLTLKVGRIVSHAVSRLDKQNFPMN